MPNLLWGALLLPFLAVTPESAEKAPPKTVTVYALTVAGGGWSAATKTRAVLEACPEIETLYLSGSYNVFTLRKGTTLAKATLDEAFAEVKMEVESYEKEERVRPTSAVAVEVEAKAVGWVNKRAKVRAALVDLEGVLDVLIDEKIVFQLAKDAQLDRKELAKRLKALELEASEPKPVEGFGY